MATPPSNNNNNGRVYFPAIEFTSSEDIEKSLENAQTAQAVMLLNEGFRTINVASAMKDLTNVGPLIQLAYCSSKGHPCAEQVIRIMSSYQTLIKSSFSASKSFIKACVSSLRNHRLALTYIEKGKLKAAVEVMGWTAKMAGEMAKISEKLAGDAGLLCQTSEDALTAATKDGSFNAQTRREVEKMMGELRSQKASLKQARVDLSKAIEQQKKEERDASKEVRDTKDRIMFMSMVNTVGTVACAYLTSGTSLVGQQVLNGLGKNDNEGQSSALKGLIEEGKRINVQLAELQTKLEKLEESLRKEGEVDKADVESKIAKAREGISELKKEKEVVIRSIEQQTAISDSLNVQLRAGLEKEAQVILRRTQFEDELRKAESTLAGAVKRLANTKIETDNLTKAINTLGVAVNTLGKIKTVFENAKLFWEDVQERCNSLADIKEIEHFLGNDSKDELESKINESGLHWLALGKININAFKAMESINKGIDQIMSNLPVTDTETEVLFNKLKTSLAIEFNESNTSSENKK